MKKLLLLLFLLPLITRAQVADDFSDGNFSANPVWTGDTAEYKISTYSSSSWSQQPRLQLDGLIADVSHAVISAPFASLDNMEWNFWVRLAFGTSSSNNARVYLVSDNPNLEGSLNGYYVMFGDDSNDALDSISFYKQNGLSSTKLIHGHIAKTGASRNYRIKVTRDAVGLWELAVDTLGQSNFLVEGTATDNTITSSSYFGVYCKYTLTNKTNFYFDDIYAGPQIVDTTAPTVVSVNPLSANQIDVAFSEFTNAATAQNTSNYNVPGIGQPSSSVIDGSDATLVHLTFSGSFVSGQIYQLQISGISDLASNVMLPDTLPFSWYTPQPFDVVINEIMADPDPSVNLPSNEYLEIYNRTAVPISLKNWLLEIGSTTGTFPNISINAHGYLILAKDDAVAALSAYGNCVGFSSFSLTNTGTTIKLKDQAGNLIHKVSYTDSWYQDPSKADGGWSIEQIDPANPCVGASNWKASTDVNGGTPGLINSVNASNPDLTPPSVNSVVPQNASSLLVVFNEVINSAEVSDLSVWTVDHSVGNPVSASVSSDEKSVLLGFSTTFTSNQIYTIYYNDTLSDCVGNIKAMDTAIFSLYQPKAYEIVINEIMADPEPVVGLPPVEYVELYNKTAFPVSLKGYTLITGTSSRNIPDATIAAGGYLLLCPTSGAAQFAAMGNAVDVSGLSLTNTGTSITLLDSLRRVISNVSYSDSWYNSSVKDDGGWSLEQKDPMNPCAGSSNWSASVDNSGGTPCRVNSINTSNPDHLSPTLVRASVNRLIPDKVRLFFSEPTDSASMLNLSKFTIDSGVGQAVAIKGVPPDYAAVDLYLAADLQNNIIYTATVTDSIYDCVGNLLPLQSSVKFAIPAVADSADVIINEVLSNPYEGGVDFVELYNRSTKVFDLREMYLADYDTLTQTVNAIYPVSPAGYLLFPGEFVALSVDGAAVKSQYRTINPACFENMASFPSLNNDEGSVALCSQTYQLIDFMDYTAGMQFPLLSSTDGVSLERISYNRPSTDKTNWHSAAESVGYATPAYQNSQYSEASGDDGAVTLSPEVFSPDNDGYQDVLNISYTFDEPGYVANISIYDNNGRIIRQLISNVMLGTSGTFSWDGIRDDAQKASVGIYIVYFEVFNTKGDVKKYKKVAVLAQRMK